MTNPFDSIGETNEAVVIDQGDGTYRVTVSLLIEINNKEVQITEQRNFVRKEAFNLNGIPDDFKNVLLDVDPEISENVGRKFYNVIKKSGADGASKREIMRACGPRATNYFCEKVLESLRANKIVVFTFASKGGRGRPRYAYFLRDMM